MLKNLRVTQRGILMAFFVVSCLLFTGCQQGGSPTTSEEPSSSSTAPNLPLLFEENVGQLDEQVAFFVKQGENTTFFTPDEVVYEILASEEDHEDIKGVVIRQRFLEGRRNVEVEGKDLQEAKMNYFKGNNKEDWKTDISTFAKIRYHQVYEGIDVDYLEKDKRIIYEYRIAAGVDPERISIEMKGVEELKRSADGDLIAITAIGNIGIPKPIAYQEQHDERLTVDISYSVISTNRYQFQIEEYDSSLPLNITQ